MMSLLYPFCRIHLLQSNHASSISSAAKFIVLGSEEQQLLCDFDGSCRLLIRGVVARTEQNSLAMLI